MTENIRLAKNPYWELLGMKVEKMEYGRAKLIMPVDEKLFQAFGVVHGGAVSSLIDSAVAVALRPMVDRGTRTATIELKVNYLAPITEGTLFAEARIVQKGGKIAVGLVEVYNGNKLAAIGLATYRIMSQQ